MEKTAELQTGEHNQNCTETDVRKRIIHSLSPQGKSHC